ncbi:MAG: pyridoxamine 5'-phosphate oxidase family protein [Halioglobus sp.]|nr:pyridoxamine 5'-phosphate oxidase family protein [Halioglobus sp.]
MSVSIKGPWDQSAVDQYLGDSRYPLRLACVGADGFPRVVSVWYLYIEGELLCVSHRASQLVGLLQRSERVGFEVAPNEPPYCGVRGQGIASLHESGQEKVLPTLLERYLGGTDSSLGQWLLSRLDEEMLIRVRPLRLFSWDYRQRMRDE